METHDVLLAEPDKIPVDANVAAPGNYRELGGAAAAGGTIRCGVIMRGALYEGGALPGATDPAGLHLFDLRQHRERGQSPPGVCCHWRPVHDPHWSPAGGRTQRFYIESSLRLLPVMCEVVAEALGVLSNGGRIYVGCRLGKDRTGLFLLLLGRALGVSDEALIADYCLTADTYLNAPGWVESYARKRGEDAGDVMARLCPLPEIPQGILARVPSSPGDISLLLGIGKQALEAAHKAVVRPSTRNGPRK